MTEALREAHRITNQTMIVKTHKEEVMETNVDKSALQQLRALSKASISDCSQALKEANSVEDALEWLKKKGIVDGLRLQGIPLEGAISSYIHTTGKVGVLLDVGCQTDFVARTEEFKKFCKDVCLHIAGNDVPPKYISEEDIPLVESTYQHTFFLQGALESKKVSMEDWASGKVDEKVIKIVTKMVDGKMSKWKKDICLMSQKFVKDPSITIADLVNQLRAITKEKIVIRRFTRYSI